MTARDADPGVCDYCGLELPRPLLGSPPPVATGVPQYCCSGCRFAHAITQERGAAGAASWTLTSLGLAIFFSMSVMVFTIALWSFDVYEAAGEHVEMRRVFGGLLGWLALMFSVPVLLLLGKPLAMEAWSNLRRGVLSSDLLLLTGVLAAFAYSTWVVIRGGGAVYFETGCVILVFVTLGRWLAATGKMRTSAALDQLQLLLPETVRRRTPTGTNGIPLDDVVLGDELEVQAGERIPIDGEIVQGAAAVDEQVFTGESVPVDRQAGDTVYAGTLNLDGTILLRATAFPRQGAFGALLAAVEAARESKGRYQLAADRLTQFFFPVIVVIAAVTVVVHGLSRGWSQGWLAGLSVVLIACPCALALATPMAVWAALGRGARKGVLFRSGEALERLAGVRALRWDKTGTLTTGAPRVVSVVVASGTDPDELRRRTALLVRQSAHVFSKAIRRNLVADDSVATGETTVRTVPGCGLEAILPGESTSTRAGRWDWVRSSAARGDRVAELDESYAHAAAQGRSIVAVGWQESVRGLYLIAEETRPQAAAVFQQLKERGFDIAILTGDGPQRAARLAAELGVPATAALSPEAKAEAVKQARRELGPTAMIGDGINDAPALAAADVGIALGCGADVTRDSADVCLLGDDLTLVPWALDLASETVRTIRGNLAWAFGYNAIGVALAAAGWLHPAIAAVLMAASSGVVVARSLRLGQDETELTSPPEKPELADRNMAGPSSNSVGNRATPGLMEAAS
ncbi:MAG: heavy metal translocating P-type ATPase [Planctomycetaceae bacterium]